MVQGASFLTKFHLACLQNIPLGLSLRRKGRHWACICLCRGSFQEPEKSGLLGGQESHVLRVPLANIGQAGHPA